MGAEGARRFFAESLRQKDRETEYFAYFCLFFFYPGATDTVGDFFIFKNERKNEKWICRKFYST